MSKLVAVLSSTVINRSGNYRIVVDAELPEVSGLPHYVGHPDTAQVINGLGAVAQPKGSLFGGLEVGEAFVAFPLQNPDRSAGWTKDQAIAGLGNLRVTVVERIA